METPEQSRLYSIVADFCVLHQKALRPFCSLDCNRDELWIYITTIQTSLSINLDQYLEVRDMTQFSKYRVLALGSGFTIMVGFATLAQIGGAQASSSLSQCTSSSSQKTVNCCESLAPSHRPLWMRQSHSSCRKAVVCRSSPKSLTSVVRIRKCSIQSPDIESKDKSPTIGGGPRISDIRLKTEIHRIGTTVLGLPLYTFQYRDRLGTYVGVMAQDVLKVEPSAVSLGANGYYLVDYGKLGIAMERIQ